jgi:hypothetical protein
MVFLMNLYLLYQLFCYWLKSQTNLQETSFFRGFYVTCIDQSNKLKQFGTRFVPLQVYQIGLHVATPYFNLLKYFWFLEIKCGLINIPSTFKLHSNGVCALTGRFLVLSLSPRPHSLCQPTLLYKPASICESGRGSVHNPQPPPLTWNIVGTSRTLTYIRTHFQKNIWSPATVVQMESSRMGVSHQLNL